MLGNLFFGRSMACVTHSINGSIKRRPHEHEHGIGQAEIEQFFIFTEKT